jgi:hypothetical protein
LQYYIDWDGYQVHEKTWENAKNLKNTPDAVADFHHRFPHKPWPCVTGLDWRKRQEGTGTRTWTLVKDLKTGSGGWSRIMILGVYWDSGKLD